MYCKVPSVFDSLLWNLRYELCLPPSQLLWKHASASRGGRDWGKHVTIWLCVVHSITAIDLRVAPQKSEAIYFHDGFRGESLQIYVKIKDTWRFQMKYLDGTRFFDAHFAQIGQDSSRIGLPAPQY